MTDNLPLIDKLAWIHIVDKKILGALSKGKDTYFIPGGKREAGETDHQALIREIKEELSVALIPESILKVGVFEAQAHDKQEGLLVRMTCYASDYHGTIRPAAEIAETAWLTYKDRDKCSAVAIKVFDWLYERGLLAE